MSYKVAVVGATGRVGTEMISVLEERDFPVSELIPLASNRSLGKLVNYKSQDIPTRDLEGFDFTGVDIVLSSAGGDVSKEFAERAGKQGAVVIDNTSYFRTDDDVPLIVPEVNIEELQNYKKKNIIANPNCSTIQMLVALAPLHKMGKVKRVVVSTYQAVSGAGNRAMEELFEQTKGVLNNQPYPKNLFTKEIAFNAIPHIDKFMEDGYTKEEWKMDYETRKILDKDIGVTATCVRLPVFVGHSLALNVEFVDDVSEEDVRAALENAEGVSVVDYRQDEGYITPVEAANEDNVFVSRIRKDQSLDKAYNMWVVADNLRKGAALNAVQIAEHLVKIL